MNKGCVQRKLEALYTARGSKEKTTCMINLNASISGTEFYGFGISLEQRSIFFFLESDVSSFSRNRAFKIQF